MYFKIRYSRIITVKSNDRLSYVYHVFMSTYKDTLLRNNIFKILKCISYEDEKIKRKFLNGADLLN